MTHVHFVGTIGLDTSEEVFAAAGKTVGAFLKRCPDGEVGGRRLWVSWQWPVLRSNAALEPAFDHPVPGLGACQLRMKPGSSESDVHFGELGYAREARTSYRDFVDARERGILPAGIRFQVSLPTPWAVISCFIEAEDVPRVFPAYQAAMLDEVRRICAAIPHGDLAIQWDVCLELLQWDGRFPGFAAFEGMKEAFERQFAILGGAVPPEAEIGIHLCYGDADAKHMVEPIDTGKAVEVGNMFISSIGRPLNWIHLPVPVSRDDEAYYAPLAGLRLTSGTELYLGLVHLNGGVSGTVRRMEAARAVVPEFGIATECGFARARTPEIARSIMQAHADAIAASGG